jgi:hypothetical protein
MSAQDLSQHQWNNRLLIVMTKDTTNLDFQNQIKILQKKEKGLLNRKLIIYQMTSTHYKKSLSKEKVWTEKTNDFQNLRTNYKGFEVMLIGLDGGIKLKQNSVLTTDLLFNIIDGMPMRQAEMRKN